MAVTLVSRMTAFCFDYIMEKKHFFVCFKALICDFFRRRTRAVVLKLHKSIFDGHPFNF